MTQGRVHLLLLSCLVLSWGGADGFAPGRSAERPAFGRAFRCARWITSVNRAVDAAGEGDSDAVLEDVNHILTRLNRAIKREDYLEAARLKKAVDALARDRSGRGDEHGGNEAAKESVGLEFKEWSLVGTAGWLADRLKNLGFFFATPCQTQAMKALMRKTKVTGVEKDGSIVEADVFEPQWRDVALQAPTGESDACCVKAIRGRTLSA